MIKLIAFDLDGVLVDAREMHYKALNMALASVDTKYIISRDEHLSKYDGLPTSQKLKLLSEQKGMPTDIHEEIWKRKQNSTTFCINEEAEDDERMQSVLRRLKEDNFKICVASNSIRETVKMLLLTKGLLKYVDFFLSNQDVKSPKPNAEIYLRCMIKSSVNPVETLIVEDSYVGRKAAINSGAHLCGVRNPNDVTYERIKSEIERVESDPAVTKWQGSNMNILIPMAGEGTRFKTAGYDLPKPLIDVSGKPMIQEVVDNLNIDANYIFIVQKSHYEKYNLYHVLNLVAPKKCRIIQVDGITEGAACTTLLAKEFINNDEPLIIANSDQHVEWDSNEFMYSMIADDVDGGILTFTANNPKWSYVKLNEKGMVEEVAEKKVISNEATCGIYYWRRGCDYVSAAEQMIDKNIRVNNEFYVCPTYNEAILIGKKIKTFRINNMWGIGTPDDLDKYLSEKA